LQRPPKLKFKFKFKLRCLAINSCNIGAVIVAEWHQKTTITTTTTTTNNKTTTTTTTTTTTNLERSIREPTNSSAYHVVDIHICLHIMQVRKLVCAHSAGVQLT